MPNKPTITDHWNVAQYEKFAHDRELPFHDLLQLIRPKKDMLVLDLGCGTGRLTRKLHDYLQAKHTFGIDSSSAMLERSQQYATETLQFEQEYIAHFSPKEKYDLIFSNAALQWLPDHPTLFHRIVEWLNPEGQIAIQMPANFDYATHTLAKELAQQAPFNEYLQSGREPSVLRLEDYAELLYRSGLKNQCVRKQVYLSVLDRTEDVVEWVKGTMLVYYQKSLSPELFEEFLKRYTEQILANFGRQEPFLFPFKRILLFGQKP